mmetsp:Transcript_5334/g.8759  ORF Transcript_5334/g.8759 Transcript_5334/m.8759 type:complete len:80 (-) Transcript_5334:228-467(-)
MTIEIPLAKLLSRLVSLRLHLSSHPHVPRYRKIYTSNDQQRVEKVKGGVGVLLAVGFAEIGRYLERQPEQESDLLRCLR